MQSNWCPSKKRRLLRSEMYQSTHARGNSHVKRQQEAAIYEQRKEASEETSPDKTWIFDF